LLLLGFALSACASIVEGTDQSIAVNLTPEDAICEVHREGAQLSTVSKDQKYVNISKSKNDLVIECQAPDHFDETVMIESSASGWGVAGCFLIDLCITDYSTGALNKYPEAINIALVPKTFASSQSRDEWFAGRQNAAAAVTRWDTLIDEKKNECRRSTNKDHCEDQLAELEEQKADALEALEDRRSQAVKGLLERGVITPDEYHAKRSQILSEL
jgi:hypothetical protein